MERKEAIEVIKKNWPDSSFTMLREALETLVPELKEKEDERIRKELIKIFEVTRTDGYNVSNEEAIAWLEKQDGHAKFRDSIQIGDKVTRNQDGVLVNLSQLNRVAKKDEKQGENISLPKFTFDDVLALQCAMETAKKVQKDKDLYEQLKSLHDRLHDAYWLKKQGEQNPTEEYNITGIGSKNAQGKLGEMIKNLKPVSEVLEQKSAWSEEDEEIHRKCICAMRASACGFPEEEKFVEQVDNWIKSIKDRVQPQSHWKPSEEQMAALSDINVTGCISYVGQGQELINLYNDLKKLMEE